MNETQDFTFFDLQEQSQDNLIGFLSTDLKVGETMLELSKTAQDLERRERLLGHVQDVLKAVAHFEGKITDDEARYKIHDQADSLRRSLSAAEHSK